MPRPKLVYHKNSRAEGQLHLVRLRSTRVHSALRTPIGRPGWLVHPGDEWPREVPNPGFTPSCAFGTPIDNRTASNVRTRWKGKAEIRTTCRSMSRSSAFDTTPSATVSQSQARYSAKWCARQSERRRSSSAFRPTGPRPGSNVSLTEATDPRPWETRRANTEDSTDDTSIRPARPAPETRRRPKQKPPW